MMRSLPTWCVVCALVIAGSSRVVEARPSTCDQVVTRIDDAASALGDPELIVELAPHVTEKAIPALIARARTATTASEAVQVYLAVGLSRHASALSQLLAAPRAEASVTRLGASIARLALGDGSRTATIANALYTGDLEVRRHTALALAQMRQKRPQIMLYDAMKDADAQVRLAAGRVHYPRHSRRARRVLLELLEGGTRAQRDSVAELLVEHRHRFNSLDVLPDHLRGRAIVQSAVRSRRGVRTLRLQLASRRNIERRAAFAGLAALSGVSPKTLARIAPKGRGATKEIYAAELTMALALMGDSNAIASLGGLTGDAATAAAEVLDFFAGAPAPYSQLDADHARSLGRSIEAWVVRGTVGQPIQARLLDALMAADPAAAATLARARLAGPPGEGLAAATAVLATTGTKQDVRLLLGLAERQSGRSRVAAYTAAAAICDTAY